MSIKSSQHDPNIFPTGFSIKPYIIRGFSWSIVSAWRRTNESHRWLCATQLSRWWDLLKHNWMQKTFVCLFKTKSCSRVSRATVNLFIFCISLNHLLWRSLSSCCCCSVTFGTRKLQSIIPSFASDCVPTAMNVFC